MILCFSKCFFWIICNRKKKHFILHQFLNNLTIFLFSDKQDTRNSIFLPKLFFYLPFWNTKLKFYSKKASLSYFAKDFYISPINSTKFFVIAIPSPVPCTLLVVLFSALVKASNIVSRYSDVMP